MTKSSVEQTKNPLFRFFEREVMIGHNLLKKIRNDLQQLILVCRGEIKQTNYLRTLMNNLTKGRNS
jgi:dynein heavy chain 1